jgi:probable rRNA maturation factor
MTVALALDVVIDFPAWETALPDVEAVAARALEAAISKTGLAGEIALLLTNDREMQALNLRWRAKDKPTDVLSFASGEPISESGSGFLGDIAIGLETMTRDAHLLGKSLADHLQHLVVHGYLHLLGYDHETDDQAREMEALEATVLASLGLPDPYEELN